MTGRQGAASHADSEIKAVRRGRLSVNVHRVERFGMRPVSHSSSAPNIRLQVTYEDGSLVSGSNCSTELRPGRLRDGHRTKLTESVIPDNIIVNGEVAGWLVKTQAKKPVRRLWHAEVVFDDSCEKGGCKTGH